MKARLSVLIVILLSVLVIASTNKDIYDISNNNYQESLGNLGNIPSSMVQIASLEFKGVSADLLFLKTMAFIGLKIKENENLTSEQWHLVYDILQLITDLDTRFFDPYLFAQMMLPWQAGMVQEANSLLQKAANNRPNDFRPYYFLGFNAFYFEQNARKAALYFEKASVLPGAPFYFKGLAARFSVYDNNVSAGIAFLQKLLQQNSNNDRQVQQYLSTRLQALQAIQKLEKALADYTKSTGHPPKRIEDVIGYGDLEVMPEDPYGGKWIILDNGRVYTTSKLVSKKHKDSKQ